MSENLNLHTIDTVDTSPFKKLVMTIGELPSSFVASMSYYEALAWLVNFLQTQIIPAVNNNAEAVEELQQLFTTLYNYVHDYFDNLDVQEEINNKLDEMATDGTLQEIVASYLNTKAVFGFDNVANMKTATNLIDGSFASTLGYYTKNDGGSAIYKIREITNTDVIDNMTIIPVGEGNLIAELASTIVFPETLGAKGDSTTDDANCIDKILELHNAGRKIMFLPKYYALGHTININLTSGMCRLDFNNCTFKALTSAPVVIVNSSLGNRPSGHFCNLVIDQNSISTVGLEIASSWRLTYDNISFRRIPASSTGAVGLWVSGSSISGKSAGNTFTNIKGDGVHDEDYETDSDYNTFIKIDAGDNTFDNIDYCFIKQGLEINANSTISNAHGFIGGDKMYVGSYFAALNSSAIMTNVYPDTQQFAFIDSSAQPVNISNVLLVFNTTAVEAETLAAHPSVAIVATSVGRNNLKINGIQIQNNVQTLYLNANQTINGVQYYRVYPVLENINSSYTSISYDDESFYMELTTEGSTYFNNTTKVNATNIHIRLLCKANYTGPMDVLRWPSGIFHNYQPVRGWHTLTVKPSASLPYAACALISDDLMLRLQGTINSGDLVEGNIPVIERQTGTA